MKKKNTIEFLRFVFCLIVCLHHLNKSAHFNGGYLAVDVFFVISGFFLMSHFQRDEKAKTEAPELSALRYLKGRVAKVLPHHIFAWICIASIQIFVTKQYSLNLVLSKCAWDFLLLRATGLGTDNAINGVTWYLSAMLIGSYLIYWVLCRNQLKGNHVFIYIYAPLVFFFVMSFIWGEGGYLNYWTQISHIMTFGFWRGLAEMGLGCMACAIVEHYRGKVKSSGCLKILITVAELVGWGIIIRYCWYGYSIKDFQIPVIVFFLLILTFLYESYLDLVLDNRVSAFLGKYSFYVYINQLIIIRPVQFYKSPFSPLVTAVLTISAIFVVSLFSSWFVNFLVKKIKTRCAAVS